MDLGGGQEESELISSKVKGREGFCAKYEDQKNVAKINVISIQLQSNASPRKPGYIQSSNCKLISMHAEPERGVKGKCNQSAVKFGLI